jgi:hypothetical protein
LAFGCKVPDYAEHGDVFWRETDGSCLVSGLRDTGLFLVWIAWHSGHRDLYTEVCFMQILLSKHLYDLHRYPPPRDWIVHSQLKSNMAWKIYMLTALQRIASSSTFSICRIAIDLDRSRRGLLPKSGYAEHAVFLRMNLSLRSVRTMLLLLLVAIRARHKSSHRLECLPHAAVHAGGCAGSIILSTRKKRTSSWMVETWCNLE